MDMDNCLHRSPTWYFYENTKMIRWSIFFFTGVCVGFAAVLWAFSVLYQHHKSGGRISFIAIFLLLSDLLELILSPALAYICKGYYPCTFLKLPLFVARLCGHLLHQLLALESILTQKYPSLAVIFSSTCSITLCIFVCVVAIGCLFVPNRFIFLSVMSVIVCVVTCTVTCKASPDTKQATDRKPGVLVLSVAMFTLIILYVPFFLNCFFNLPFMFDVLVSMRLISEPLLCVLICRENRLVQAKASFAAQ